MSTGRIPCHKCKEIIVGMYYSYGNQYYHATCFKCPKCGTSLMNGFHIHDDLLLCDNCYNGVIDHKLPECPTCHQKVKYGAPFIVALDHRWHVDCFRCSKCQQTMHEFFSSGHKVYCKQCYQQKVAKKKAKKRHKTHENQPGAVVVKDEYDEGSDEENQ